MNYKHKPIVNVNGKIYNLESWISIEVVDHNFGAGNTKALKILFPDSTSNGRTISNNLFLTYEAIKPLNIPMKLGVSPKEIYDLFLIAEVDPK